jgi:glycine/D-amino acid oxidase-like deaminating enzyme
LRQVSFNDLAGVAADVCIVGAGPVGLAAARRLSGRGLTVLVLEAGDPSGSRSVAPPADCIIGNHHAPLAQATATGFGGTSRFWGGRCLPLDPIDLEARWGDQAAWPIGYNDVALHFAAAADFLGCGPARFEDHGDGAAATADGLRTTSLERWSDEPWITAHLRRSALPDRVVLSPASTVTHATLDPSGRRIGSLNVRRGDASVAVSAPIFIFAAGGIETTRLLLATQARRPDLFGGPEGPLGRYYMGHLSGSIADIVFASPATSRSFAYRAEPDSMVRRRITFDPQVLREAALPNIGFYPDNPRLADATHGRGILSALYLLLATPGVGRRLLPEAILGMQLRDASSLGAHLKNLAFDAPNTAAAMARLAWQKVMRGRRKPSLFLLSREGRHPLHYHAEQLPSAESCISLLSLPGPDRLATLRIDLRFDDTDAAGVARAHEVLDAGLRQSGLGRLAFKDPVAARRQAILGQARDGYHQIGLARMGAHAGDGVVDADCRAFDLDNLYLAGTAVFRTGGQANPTFFATALAMRLADHLADRLSFSRSTAA